MTFDAIAYNEARLAKLAAIYGSLPAAVKIFPTSDTYPTPFDAYVDFMCIGAGPSGGITHGNGGVGGGGAGECAYYLGLFVPAGTVFTASVGVGGAPQTRGTAGQTWGNAGTQSSIVAASISFNLTAYPGDPGVAGNSGGLRAGGAGGTGGAGVSTAGSVHYAGGPGGSANSATFGVAGGGAVNVMGWSDPATRLVGGSLTAGTGGAGGAGVGGKGGEKNTATASSFSAGGGSGGPADDGLSAAATAGKNAAGARTQASMSSLVTPA
ncbi:MAG: hypothetical protein EOO27_42270, partial [Comamonadaceae bacterium]